MDAVIVPLPEAMGESADEDLAVGAFGTAGEPIRHDQGRKEQRRNRALLLAGRRCEDAGEMTPQDGSRSGGDVVRRLVERGRA